MLGDSSQIVKILKDAVADRFFPCACLAVGLRDEFATLYAAGKFTYALDSSAVTNDTPFDLASLSKIIATTAMAMLLYERSKLDLDQPIAQILSEFLTGENDARRRSVTFRMLLSHSSGLPAHRRFFEQTTARRYSPSA